MAATGIHERGSPLDPLPQRYVTLRSGWLRSQPLSTLWFDVAFGSHAAAGFVGDEPCCGQGGGEGADTGPGIADRPDGRRWNRGLGRSQVAQGTESVGGRGRNDSGAHGSYVCGRLHSRHRLGH